MKKIEENAIQFFLYMSALKCVQVFSWVWIDSVFTGEQILNKKTLMNIRIFVKNLADTVSFSSGRPLKSSPLPFHIGTWKGICLSFESKHNCVSVVKLAGLWEELVVFAARHQDKVNTGCFRSTYKRAESTLVVDSVKRSAFASTELLSQRQNMLLWGGGNLS